MRRELPYHRESDWKKTAHFFTRSGAAMDDNSLSCSNVKVAVRVRPMNRREKDLKTKCVVEMEGKQTILHPAISNVNKGDP
ncbi:kinesin-like protein kif13a, partial [Ilyodon furcidens]